MRLAAGTRLGAYEVVAPLGTGGMGEVYRGRDTRLDRPVAIKLLRAQLAADTVQRERFEREARSVSSLLHPNVCTLFDVGEHEGHRFLVMELLEGETLAERLAHGPLAPAEALRLARELAAALAAAHRRGIVHRDVKPANVALTEHGAKLLDFGLAKGRDEPAPGSAETTLAQTSPGVVVGTLAYMSPEQLTGGAVDQRADVYAFGVTLFEACTGRRPFAGDDAASLMLAVLRDTPPSASRAPGVPAGLAPVIDRCLERDASRRFPSAESLQAALAREDLGAAPAAAAAGEPGLQGALLRLRSVGVLDFRNITTDPAFDWLSTGIAETLTTDLSKLQAFAVVGRDRVVRALGAPGTGDGTAPDSTEAGRRLGLDLVVTGGYQTMGRSVRLTASLIDVAKGEIAGSVKVDGLLDEVFSLQDRLVGGLAEAARVSVPDSARERLARADDPKVGAYELFARGRQLVQRMGPAGLSEARGLLERAVEIDPRYALAHAALGSARAMRFIATSDPEDLEAAVSHLTRATQLDPRLGEPHAWLAYCRGRQHRFAEARDAGRRAIELDPGSFYGFYFLGAALWMEGNEAFRPGVWAEAAGALRGAAQILPRAITTPILQADVFLRCGRVELAQDAARRGVELEESGQVDGPRMPGAHAVLGLALACSGRDAEAARALAASAERLAAQDHVYAPAYLAMTFLGEAEIALRQGRAGEAYARCREVVETCRRHARTIGMGWLAVRGRLGLAAAAHSLLISKERDAALAEALALLRDRVGYDFGTIFLASAAVAWMDAARLYDRLGREADAFDALVQSIEAGWSDPVTLEHDPGLARLRSRPEFPRLLQVVAARAHLPEPPLDGVRS